jgi:hypothetical protein
MKVDQGTFLILKALHITFRFYFPLFAFWLTGFTTYLSFLTNIKVFFHHEKINMPHPPGGIALSVYTIGA